MSNKSKLLTVLAEQIEHCKAQGFTDAEVAQAVIDSTADWFEDTLSLIGMSPVVINAAAVASTPTRVFGMKESQRTSREVSLRDYDHLAELDSFLEVTEWSNGEGFDLHLSRGEQSINLSWGEWSALLAALGDWIDQPQPESTCPHIVSTDEGTSYCKLAESTAELLAKLRS